MSIGFSSRQREFSDVILVRIYTKDLPKDRFTLPPGMAIRFLLPSEEATGRLRRMIAEQLVGDIVAEQDESVVRR